MNKSAEVVALLMVSVLAAPSVIYTVVSEAEGKSD